MELVINDTATSRLVTAERTFQLLSGTWPVGNGRLDQDPDAVLSASCSDAAARRRTIGLVGAARSVNSQSAALLGASFQQPQVSYSSTSHELSDKSVYPYFCRVVPSDAAQAKALAAVVKVYGWSSVAVLATSDSYGAGISNDFLSAVDAAGVDVVSLSTFRSADTGLEIQRALKDIRESNSRIIVANLIASDAQLVLKLAVDAGMLGPKSGYVWIGSDGWTTPALLEPIEGNLVDEADLARIGELLVGSIGVQPYRETEAFASLWAASRARLEAQFGVEAGAWTEINSFTPFAYDAVWTFVHAVQRLKEAGGDPSVGAQLLDAIKGLSFSGTTGPMNISSQCEPASSYEITNANAAGSFVRVTTWTPQSPDSLESASAITFPDGSTIPPTSQFREVVWISYDVKVATVVLLGILTLHAVVLHAYVMANRFDTVMRAASPNLMHLVIFGAIVSYGAVAVLGFGDGIFPECHAPYFMMCVAVNFTFGTLVAREFRIHRVFNNRSLRDRKVLKDRNLYLFVFVFCIYDTLVHIGYWLLSPATFVVKASLAEDYEDIVNCEYDGVWVFVALSVTPKLVLFAYGSVLAWQVRAIDWNFNESRSIAMAIWNVIVVIVVTAGLWYWLREHVEAAYLVLVACVAVTSLSVHGIVIVPRLLNTYARKKRIQESENLTSSMPKLPGSDLGNSISNNTIPLEETVNYRTITCTNCGVKLLSRKYSERRTVGGPSDGLRSRTTSALRVDTAASMDDGGGTELVEESSDEALTPQSVV